MVWSTFADVEPARKCAAVILQLRGGAAEFVQDLPVQATMYRGMVNGVQIDSMTYLMRALGERYAQLGEEVRLEAITELLSFERRRDERMDDLLTRFDSARQRANDQGQLAVSIHGISWLLLRAVGVNDQEMLTLLQPWALR